MQHRHFTPKHCKVSEYVVGGSGGSGSVGSSQDTDVESKQNKHSKGQDTLYESQQKMLERAEYQGNQVRRLIRHKAHPLRLFKLGIQQAPQ